MGRQCRRLMPGTLTQPGRSSESRGMSELSDETSWNLADIWELVADVVPARPAQVCGDRRITWSDFDRRADALAADLLDVGISHQGKLAVYLTNGPEYLESYAAAFKIAAVPVNVNYRYGPAELEYLLDNADTEAVVFHARFAPNLDEVRGRLGRVRRWYVVSDGHPEPDWATSYDEVVARVVPRPHPDWKRSGDDLLLLYTGGTTGMPKGVMWRNDDLVRVLGGGGSPFVGLGPASGLREMSDRLKGGSGLVTTMPACPLMHGTGQFSAFITMIIGGCVVTLPGSRFDAEELWSAVESRRVNTVAIVGDAFARPMLEALEANPGRWDLTSLILINSSGVMWSEEVKHGLSKHLPSVVLFDSLGSSEAVGMGASMSAGASSAKTAEFALGAGARVVDEDDRDVRAGSGEVGVIALPGHIPVGYYKDPEKSSRTFRTIDGVRYTIPGDCATVDADGSIRLLGRGSVVINTGGEKVYPEEVEEVIKKLPEVADAVCVGVPDQRFGERVCALVELTADEQLSDEEVIRAVRAELAVYKAPRLVVFVESIGRSPAGKVDYPGLKKLASSATGREAPKTSSAASTTSDL